MSFGSGKNNLSGQACRPFPTVFTGDEIMKKIIYAILVLAMLPLVSGCALVKPWEREYLADPIMQFDYNKEEKAVREHFLGTREGSVGGFGVSGGGCGCN